ncbi:low affinity iron permease family protein [Mycolicibacterium farcinogenes]|nr:low affinity iron permease family protein [Mycolicibacterium farcinogenes]
MTGKQDDDHEVRNVSDAVTAVLDRLSHWAGTRWTATAVTAAMVVYVMFGVAVGFEHWWQVSVHTAAAVVTLPMLFVLQHTTNRETTAILIKLDELIQATTDAKEVFVDLEDNEVDDQKELHDHHHHDN